MNDETKNMDERYRFLFPFEKIPYGSRIIIYGAGKLGHEYLKQIRLTNYCRVEGIIDRNADLYDGSEIPVYKPDMIKELSFDYAVVAIRIDTHKKDIFNLLYDNGIDPDRIICTLERNVHVITSGLECYSVTDMSDASYGKTMYSVAVLLTGGIGDNIIQKRFIVELSRYLPNALIDIYSLQNKEFKEYLFSDIDQVNGIFDDLGYLYEREKNKYSLAIFIEACSFIKIDAWKKTIYENKHNEFVSVVEKLIARSEEEHIDITIPTMISIKRKLFNGMNAYTGLGYGILDLRDRKVNIPITDNGKTFFDSLEIRSTKFFTVNCGNGICSTGQRIAKSWPKEKFEEVISEIKQKHKDVNAVQVGDEHGALLDGADYHFMGEAFENVALILSKASFHLDIEGGLVHMASQLGTRCIVLFGPTSMEFYGYEDNINIRNEKCYGCAGLYTDAGACTRRMDKPECMYDIDIDTILNSADSILSS